MIKDIATKSLFGNPGSMATTPKDMTGVNGMVYFSAMDDSAKVCLWKSDGTEAGTVVVKTLEQTPYSDSTIHTPTNLTNVNGTLFFAINKKLFRWTMAWIRAGRNALEKLALPW